MIKPLGDEFDQISKTKRHAWYIQKDGFWRWVTEKILRKKWLRMPSYAMHYYNGLSEEERRKLDDQWLKEARDYIEEFKRKGLIY